MTEPVALAAAARAADLNSRAVPYSVTIHRLNDRNRTYTKTRSFQDRAKAMAFYNSLHRGAYAATIKEFNGEGYTTLAERGGN